MVVVFCYGKFIFIKTKEINCCQLTFSDCISYYQTTFYKTVCLLLGLLDNKITENFKYKART